MMMWSNLSERARVVLCSFVVLGMSLGGSTNSEAQTTLVTPTAVAQTFQALDRTTASRLVQAASYAQPTIVALWSAECTHCKKNLALFAALARQHPHLQLITIATETLDVARAEPLNRLALPGTRYAFGDEQHEALAYALDPKWHGELPRTLLFDGHGGKQAVSGLLSASAVQKALGLE